MSIKFGIYLTNSGDIQTKGTKNIQNTDQDNAAGQVIKINK